MTAKKDATPSNNTPNSTPLHRLSPVGAFALGVITSSFLFAALAVGFLFGRTNNSGAVGFAQPELAKFLDATATHGGKDLAIATGQIDEDTEGIYFLDMKTGDLQCWIYYPRQGQFGAKVASNVSANLPGGKNAEYLMVTGKNFVRGASANSRPAASIVYVVDTKTGVFAAYSFPWSEAAQNSGQIQALQFSYLGGGKIRS